MLSVEHIKKGGLFCRHLTIAPHASLNPFLLHAFQTNEANFRITTPPSIPGTHANEHHDTSHLGFTLRRPGNNARLEYVMQVRRRGNNKTTALANEMTMPRRGQSA